MAKPTFHGPLERVDDCLWRIPRSNRPEMRVDGLIFARDVMMAPAHGKPPHISVSEAL